MTEQDEAMRQEPLHPIPLPEVPDDADGFRLIREHVAKFLPDQGARDLQTNTPPLGALQVIAYISQLRDELVRARTDVAQVQDMEKVFKEQVDTFQTAIAQRDELLKNQALVIREFRGEVKTLSRIVRGALGDKPPSELHLIFSGPPGPDGCHFVEVEDGHGNGVDTGVWFERPDGTWALAIGKDV